jgi:hypothetical protein
LLLNSASAIAWGSACMTKGAAHDYHFLCIGDG